MSNLIVGASSLAPISYLGLFKLKSLKIYEIDQNILYIITNSNLKIQLCYQKEQMIFMY